jgi:ankyrin repeat protein
VSKATSCERVNRLQSLVFALVVFAFTAHATRLAYRPQTGICGAAVAGDVDTVRSLLALNPAAIHETDRSASALHWAADYGQTAVVECLLTNGAPVNATNQWGGTALQRAASRGSEQVVRLLLAHHADPSILDQDGETALGMACSYGRNLSVVTMLLDHQADPNRGNPTPLQEAAFRGEDRIIELLVQRGANINARGFDGAGALHWAVDGRHENTVKLLLARGASPVMADDQGKTSQQWATERRAAEKWWKRGKLRRIDRLLRENTSK